MKDGQASISDLAKNLEIHKTTVYRKICFLVENEVLKIVAIPNTGKLFVSTHAQIILDVIPSKIDYVSDHLYNCSELTSIMVIVCASNIILGVNVNSNEMLLKFIKTKILCLKEIRSIETLIRAETNKRSYGMLLDERTITSHDQISPTGSI